MGVVVVPSVKPYLSARYDSTWLRSAFVSAAGNIITSPMVPDQNSRGVPLIAAPITALADGALKPVIDPVCREFPLSYCVPVPAFNVKLARAPFAFGAAFQ